MIRLKFTALMFACLFSFTALTGCIQQGAAPSSPSPEQQARASASPAPVSSDPVAACVALCENARLEECGGARLSECGPWNEGPCLSDDAARKREAGLASDWVCDVAHFPRVPADDNPANQCAEYRNGGARHFVEVDVDCKTIRVV